MVRKLLKAMVVHGVRDFAVPLALDYAISRVGRMVFASFKRVISGLQQRIILGLGRIEAPRLQTIVEHVALVFLGTGTCLAEEHAAHTAGHASISEQLFWPCANFITYLFLLVYLYRKYGQRQLKARSVQIRQQLEKTSVALAAVQDELDVLERRLANIETEKASLRQAFVAEGRRLSEMALVQGRAAAERVLQDVEKQIQSEIQVARKQIRQRVVELATKKARAKLLSGSGVSDDRKLRRDALRHLFE